MVIWYSLS